MAIFFQSAVSLAGAVEKLLWLTLVFAVLALLVRGLGAFRFDRAKVSETRVNLIYYLTDAAIAAPLLSLFAGMFVVSIREQGLPTILLEFWSNLPGWLVLIVSLMVSDFVTYWRHRMMHTAVLWPAHAIHHSDRELSWLSLIRFHPINRIIAFVMGTVTLAVLGFPLWVVVLNSLFRSWYGYFVHANLPWTYGPIFGRIFVSPVLHRWHHTRDIAFSGNNFAAVFSFYDVLFRTWHCPSKTVGDLGIEDHGFPASWAGQILWPFRIWLGLRSEPNDASTSP